MQSALLGWFWGLTALKHYGNKALWHYGTIGPDYMRPVRTQTGTTSDRSPYKCFLLSTWSRSEKSSHAGFTHSGCWTDTNDSDRSEVGPRNHVNTNWFETGSESVRDHCFEHAQECCWTIPRWRITGKRLKKIKLVEFLGIRWLRIWLKHWKLPNFVNFLVILGSQHPFSFDFLFHVNLISVKCKGQ